MTTVEQAAAVIKDNLYLVFGEEDVSKRNEAIQRLYTSEKSVFVGPEGVFHGHESISKCVDAVQANFVGWKFKHRDEARVVPPDGEADTRFAKILWEYGPADDPSKVQGEDVAVIVNGKIQSLVAFIG